MNLSDLLQEWFTFLRSQKSFSAHTIRAYQNDIGSFISFLTQHLGESLSTQHLQKLTLIDFRSWVSDLHHQKKLSARAIARSISCIKSFFKFTRGLKGIDNPYVTKIKGPRLKKSLPRPLDHQETENLLDYFKEGNENWIQKRDYTLFLMLYGTGLRISEALSLNYEDIYEYQSVKKVIKVMGKRNKERLVPLAETVQEALLEYLDVYPYPLQGKCPLFLGEKGKRLNQGMAQKNIRQYRALYGLSSKLTPHALRHTCASHLLGNNGSLKAIQELLGHASLSTTQIYTDLVDEKILEEFENTHPRRKWGE